MIQKYLGRFIFSIRWILYPVHLGLIAALCLYVWAFLVEDFHAITGGHAHDMEQLMVLILGLVDASMVANLVVMIVQGGHQIFIHKFEEVSEEERPQYLDHIDSGILKVKVALSIASITLVQLLKDFVNVEHVDWLVVKQRIVLHVVALISALVVAIIWKIMKGHANEAH